MRSPFLYLLLPFLLSACTQVPPAEPIEDKSWIINQQQLEQLTHWSFSGKLALITSDKRSSVNIHWQQSGDEFTIHLTTFLGLNVLKINKTLTQTTIIDAQGKRYHSANSEKLISELSGITIPITYLQEWIKGNPHHAQHQLNSAQLVASLLAAVGGDIWLIKYNDHRAIEGFYLPHKLQLKSAQLRLKFSISKWEITH